LLLNVVESNNKAIKNKLFLITLQDFIIQCQRKPYLRRNYMHNYGNLKFPLKFAYTLLARQAIYNRNNQHV